MWEWNEIDAGSTLAYLLKGNITPMKAEMIGVGRYINLSWNHSDALVLHRGLDVPDKDFWFSSFSFGAFLYFATSLLGPHSD